MKEGSGNGASLTAVAVLGEPGGGLLCWGSGGGLWGRASLYMGILLGSLEGDSFTGGLRTCMLKKALETDISLRGGLFENLVEGDFRLPGALRDI